jgi:cytochrome c553
VEQLFARRLMLHTYGSHIANTVARASTRRGPYQKVASTQNKETTHKKSFMKKIVLLTIGFTAVALLSVAAADVKENWEKTCAKCHGPDGKGDTKMGQKLGIKDLTDAKLQGELKDDQAFKAVKEGIKDSEGKIKMKPAEGLSDDDIKALVAHVRTLKK